MSLEDGKVLETDVLAALAVIAAANDRSLVEELNVAVRSYIVNELAEHGEFDLLERAVAQGSRVLIE